MTRALHRVALLALALAALASPGLAVAAVAEDRAALQAELSSLAPRIELLKREAAAGRGAGAELERLLAQAQALAARLERLATPAGPGPAPPGPDAGELRERADALRDRADKQAAALVRLEGALAEARRRAALSEGLEALGAASDLFADGVTSRGGLRQAATDGPPPGPGSLPVGPGEVGAAVGGPLASPATAASELRAAPAPGGVAGLTGAEEPRALERRRAELVRSVEGLRRQAEALEAEAKAADGAR
ncbi:MAG: hypothetical protein IPO09_01485 [Anaeromyxobacter sp.]|nr:hypothetical protein [Anaeromyxobacter sp.]